MMTERIVEVIIAGGGGLLAAAIMIIKFAVFDVLQKQITVLQDGHASQAKEIITLRKMVDEWQEKYYKLNAEYAELQVKYERIQNSFERFQHLEELRRERA
jgi:anti-sigma-K factor RskA